MNELQHNEKDNFSGYLSKRSLTNYQDSKERYFTIIEGQFLAYFINKEQRLLKGIFDLDLLKNITASGINNLHFDYGKNTLVFISSKKTERDNWFDFLNSLISNLKMNKKDNLSLYDIRSNTVELDENGNEILKEDLKAEFINKPWKNFNFSKEALKLLEKNKILLESKKEKEVRLLSKRCLKLKGIEKILNMKDPLIKHRICFGFMEKKNPNDFMNLYQRRWLFMISSKPVTNLGLANDDRTLEESFLQNKLKFDTIYYYKVNNDEDISEAKGSIEISQSNGLSISDKDSRFIIQIDMGVRIFEFYTVHKYEIDKWRECLTNSLKLCKDIKFSITGKPKNVNKIINIFENEGIGSLKLKIEEEIEEMIKLSEIKNFENLTKITNELKDKLFFTIDGCLLYEPIPEEVFKNYTKIYNYKILFLIEEFWKNHYSKLFDTEILGLVTILLDYDKNLDLFGVVDPNIKKNADELIKILKKKLFWQSISTIEAILKLEREKKAEKINNKIFSTISPNMFFKSIFNQFEMIKEIKHEIILENFLENTKFIIIQYLVGIDTIIRQRNLDIDKEYLIAVANNTLFINQLLDDLIESIETYEIYSKEEINIKIQKNEIISSLMIIRNFSIFRFVIDLYDILLEKFEESFLHLNTEEIIELCNEIYSEFEVHMDPQIRNKFWKEVLSNSISNYIICLFLNDDKNIKNVDQLKKKIGNDNYLFNKAYTEKIGPESINEILKNLDYVLEFLDSSSDMIALSCQSLREFNGPSFTISSIKHLIDLRSDFTEEERKEAFQTCKEVLNNFKENKTDKITNPLFNFIAKKIKSDNRRLSYSDPEKSIEDDFKYINKGNNLNKEQLLDFGIEVSDEEEVQEKETFENKFENFYVPKNDKENAKAEIEVVLSGYMQKKSYDVWQRRFFQIKQGQLFWFKKSNDSTALNFLNIKEILKIKNLDNNKFELICKKKNYDFLVENKDKRDEWVSALNAEIKKLSKGTKKKYDKIFEMELKKKVIDDLFNFGSIEDNNDYMKINIDDSMKREKYFLPKEEVKPSLNVQKSILKSKTLKFEILNKPISEKTLNLEEVEKNERRGENKSIFSCCSKLLRCCRKKKEILLEKN